MVVRPHRVFLIVLCVAAFCLSICAQKETTITVRMLDNRTGNLIASSNYLVRINHQQEQHGNWIVKNEDGSGNLALPADAEVVSVRATYEDAMLIYVNCDAGMEKDVSTLHWYSVPDILSAGVAMPNECYKGKYADATKVTPKPGEFILFVRKINWHELPPD